MAPPSILTISRYRTRQVCTIDFFGNNLIVTVTPTPSVIRRWITTAIFNYRRSCSPKPLVVGVCVNWTPNFSHSDSSSPPSSRYDSDSSSSDSDSPPADPEADTLQLCIGRRCIVIQLTNCNRVPLILRRFLANPRTTFVGVWNSQDAGKLKGSRHKLEIGKLLDVRMFVYDSCGYSLRRCKFEKIVELRMSHNGVCLDQEISRGDWSVYYLSAAQILQASIKPFVCFKLGVAEKLWQY